MTKVPTCLNISTRKCPKPQAQENSRWGPRLGHHAKDFDVMDGVNAKVYGNELVAGLPRTELVKVKLGTVESLTNLLGI